ncbi:MAG: helix-turn-helix domain-containing protein [Polaromonas sp.]
MSTPLSLPTSAAQRTISIVGDAWTLRILRTLFRRQRRYGDFLRELGVSRAVLTDRLANLVAHGVLIRHVKDGHHPEYLLTQCGLDLWTLFLSMWLWETEWGTGGIEPVFPEVDRPRRLPTHTLCNHTMHPQLKCTHCGIPVLPFDTVGEPGPGASSAPVQTTSGFRRARQEAAITPGRGSSQKLFRLVGDRWNSAIVAAAFSGVRLFSEFEKNLQIAPSQLSDRLAELQALGILRAKAYAGSRQEYHLTRAGIAVFPITLELMRWGDQWFWPGAAPVVVRHLSCGHLLTARWHCSHCQQRLERKEIHFPEGAA